MATLLNGRGQLGEKLKKRLSELPGDAHIYHTWQVKDKSKAEQIKQYCLFKSYVDENSDKKIVFISTKSQKDTWYTYYKQLSEAYLLTKCEKGIVIRLPTFIGKPSKLFDSRKDIDVYGEVELISLEDVVAEIINICKRDMKIKIVDVNGEKVSAKTVRQIVEAAE
tara:strand:- start:4313 stop:4810 length:498 start_codon:yes stop_codon:yes gene_type:complete